MKKVIFFFCLLFCCVSCGNGSYKDVNVYNYNKSSHTKGEKVKYSNNGGHYKVGKPYKVAGKTYYPKVDTNYKEVGFASWYGSDFHNKKTANGEIFSKNELTAAHKTLPLPSIVKVTNLENGKSIKVKVNDRGPFVNNRIIDLSEKAGIKLGMKEKGVVKVKVEYLKSDTENLLKYYN